jgi:hypothetical protein
LLRGREVTVSPEKARLRKTSFLPADWLWMAALDPAVVLHAVGEGVADQADGVAVLQRQLGVAGCGREEGGERDE